MSKTDPIERSIFSGRAPSWRVLSGLGAGALAAVIWAGWIVWTDLQVAADGAPGGDAFTPFDIALLRLGPPALLLAPFWLRAGSMARSWKPPQTPWLNLLMMNGWGAPFVLLAATGLQTGGATLMAALVPGLAPLFGALIGAVVFGVRLTRSMRLALGLIAAAALVGFIAAPADERPAALWFLAAALGWGAYVAAFPQAGLSPAQAVGLLSGWSTALLLLIAPFAPSNLGSASWSALGWEFALQGCVSGALAVLAYSIALDRAPRMIGANLPVAVPLLAVGGAALFTTAEPTALQVSGVALATVGLFLLAASRSKNRGAAPDGRAGGGRVH